MTLLEPSNRPGLLVDVTAGIPLRRRGGTIRGWTWVDLADFEAVSAYRWSLDSVGYPQTTIRQAIGWQTVRLHRFLMGDPPEPGLVNDHQNRWKLDNRRSNLRWVTRRINNLNGDSAPARNARKSKCIRGHPLSGPNVRVRPDGSRRCLACQRDYDLHRRKAG